MNAVEKVVAYDTDFYDWVTCQARLMKARRFAELDLAHLIEEIEDLGNEQLFKVQSWTVQIQAHLACLRWCPNSEPRSHWQDEIRTWRINTQLRLQSSPSLRRKLAEGYDKLWKHARGVALGKLARDGITRLPEACPFTLEQVLEPDYFPEYMPPTPPQPRGRKLQLKD